MLSISHLQNTNLDSKRKKRGSPVKYPINNVFILCMYIDFHHRLVVLCTFNESNWTYVTVFCFVTVVSHYLNVTVLIDLLAVFLGGGCCIDKLFFSHSKHVIVYFCIICKLIKEKSVLFFFLIKMFIVRQKSSIFTEYLVEVDFLRI